MTKRVWVAAVAGIVVLAGCGSGDKSASNETAGSKQTETAATGTTGAPSTEVVTGPTNLLKKPVPAFTLKGVNGAESFTNDSLKGKVVVLDFWATWCGPCKAASPHLDALYKKYGKDGLVVIGANGEDPEPKVAGYQKEHGYTYPFAVASADVKKAMQIENLPVFIFVDRSGAVQRVDTGFDAKTTPAEWDKAVSGLLAQK